MTVTDDTTAPAQRRAPRIRTDAARNRVRILAAARETLVELGPEVPLDEIARRAGVGNATVYRHFPDRGALLHDVLLFVITRTAEFAEGAAAQQADPFGALRGFAHAAVDERAAAVCGLFTAVEQDGAPEDVYAEIGRLRLALEELMERARRAGALRPDVTQHDLMVAISQLTRPLPGLECRDTDAHRHLDMFLDGLRPHPAPPATPTPIGP
ncbi:helix-turn-helix domain-containing protein [Streptomyces sp. V4-01]|uniref:Helix-turn-helix domain-containing protein n=1 Tax=Actinacidiphila polyblastidii TaxID=3110430 RepID=A0ABU7P8Z1_9ACTN|nr:helix-turn-helix domain-containing protein [Streptomyces sp. V4-01]